MEIKQFYIKYVHSKNLGFVVNKTLDLDPHLFDHTLHEQIIAYMTDKKNLVKNAKVFYTTFMLYFFTSFRCSISKIWNQFVWLLIQQK